MRIRSVTAHPLEYPEPHDHGKLRYITLARVESDDGAVGWGECISQFPESAVATKIVIENGYAPLLVGESALEVEACRQLVNTVAQDFGRLDILVNNAGICPRLSFADSTEEDWEKLMRVNAKSQYFLCQAVCPIMKEQGGGRIINIASTGGRTGSFANASIYSGTKGAIVMFTKSIAREVAGDNILINCIAPGVLDPQIMQDLPEDKTRSICEQIPLKRLGRPEEIAATVAFLASDECSYATGATFDINGGWFMF